MNATNLCANLLKGMFIDTCFPFKRSAVGSCYRPAPQATVPRVFSEAFESANTLQGGSVWAAMAMKRVTKSQCELSC
jgi:hypothetical protein